MTPVTHRVDLTNCDREPIHIPGSIQPHGAMLVCADDMVVTHASANAEAFLGLPVEAIIGAPLNDVLGAEAAHDLRNAGARAGGAQIAGVLVGLSPAHAPHPLDATIHKHDRRIIVELEHSLGGPGETHAALDLTQSLVRRLSLQVDVEGIANAGAKLIRALLDYDRVMVYRFLHNDAGQVIAEASRGRQTYLDQHFPASDIPAQARRLYLINWIRVIGDSAYVPVPMLTGGDVAEAPLDMSHAHLRSVSPVHCEYLQNMKVEASMSISIVVDGKLWGLIACHHQTPKTVPMPLRIGAELFGQYFSLQIAVAQRRAEFQAASAARRQLDQLVREIRADEPMERSLRDRLDGLASLIPCDGAALWIEGKWASTGITPPPEAIGELMDFLNRTAEGAVWDTHELRLHLGDAYGSTVAGLLAVPISSLARDYLVLFRSEEAYAIEWAGKPEKEIVAGPLGDRLTPRGSFAAWKEEVRGKSRPWSEAERAVAGAIRTYLRDVVLRYNETIAADRERAEQRRQVLNNELNHRIKNILALVKSIASQTATHATSVKEYSTSLEGRLRALAFAHDQSLAGGGGSLGALIEAEADFHRYGAADRIVTSGPPIGLDDRTFGVVALVIHEMMTNAAKYGSLSVPAGKLRIRWVVSEQGDCEIYWQEFDGPPVAPPSRAGFGSTLIDSTLTYDLGGIAEVHYETGGVRARFVLPREHLAETAQETDDGDLVPVEARPLEGLDILLVEDQALIALDTEETLKGLGARRVRSCPNEVRALAEIGAERPDCAVLDFSLGDRTAVAIAEMLLGLKVPFVFATGYGESSMIPALLSHIPIISKPVSAAALSRQLAKILAPPAGGQIANDARARPSEHG